MTHLISAPHLDSPNSPADDLTHGRAVSFCWIKELTSTSDLNLVTSDLKMIRQLSSAAGVFSRV